MLPVKGKASAYCYYTSNNLDILGSNTQHEDYCSVSLDESGQLNWKVCWMTMCDSNCLYILNCSVLSADLFIFPEGHGTKHSSTFGRHSSQELPRAMGQCSSTLGGHSSQGAMGQCSSTFGGHLSQGAMGQSVPLHLGGTHRKSFQGDMGQSVPLHLGGHSSQGAMGQCSSTFGGHSSQGAMGQSVPLHLGGTHPREP